MVLRLANACDEGGCNHHPWQKRSVINLTVWVFKVVFVKLDHCESRE